ncbi:Flagellar basal-body rod protein FlgF [hydrothermal vent metagenome]|uniref:Flagellar basal-body rod protein FlgF n=1 Tax=hydrothermal vent metagenome TaxID=652676 RepID=A0A3B1BW76_9ZZZZ
MDRMLYVAMSGASETLLAQGANSNNLANASTTGFLSDLQQFRSMPVFGEGFPTRVYAMTERPDIDFTRGSIQSTGRDLDVAVRGKGWIAVQAKDGSEALTRAGDLQIDVNGLLLTGTGLPVMGNSGPIALPPAEKIEIGADGTISVRSLGQAANALAIVDRIKLVTPPVSELQKGQDGLMRLKSGLSAEPDADARLTTGTLESSNVNTVKSLVDMIELARRFEMQVKMMKTAEEMDSASATLLRI